MDIYLLHVLLSHVISDSVTVITWWRMYEHSYCLNMYKLLPGL